MICQIPINPYTIFPHNHNLYPHQQHLLIIPLILSITPSPSHNPLIYYTLEPPTIHFIFPSLHLIHLPYPTTLPPPQPSFIPPHPTPYSTHKNHNNLHNSPQSPNPSQKTFACLMLYKLPQYYLVRLYVC